MPPAPCCPTDPGRSINLIAEQPGASPGTLYNHIPSDGDESRVLHADLLVLDARSGDELHRLRLPDMTVPRFSLTDLEVREAGDGVIRVAWLEALHDVLFVT